MRDDFFLFLCASVNFPFTLAQLTLHSNCKVEKSQVGNERMRVEFFSEVATLALQAEKWRLLCKIGPNIPMQFCGRGRHLSKKVFLAEASVIVWESKRGAVDKQKVKKEFYALLGATKNCVNCLLFFFFYPILSFPFKMRKHVFPPLPSR